MLLGLIQAWRILQQKGYCEVRVIAGLAGMKETVIGLPQRYSKRIGSPTYESHVIYNFGTHDLSEAKPDLAEFFEYLWECYGAQREA